MYTQVSYKYIIILEVMLFDTNKMDFKSIRHSWHSRLYFKLEKLTIKLSQFKCFMP